MPREAPGAAAPARPAPARPTSPAPGRQGDGPPPSLPPRGTATAAAPAGPGGPRGPGGDRPSVAPAPGRARRIGRRVAQVVVVLLVLLLAWPIGLAVWADGRLEHVEALSGAAGTPGTTFLIAGSDSRDDGVIEDAETLGARTDTIMLLHQPASGPAALISLPRDSYVAIPGNEPNKLNAAFSWGGPALLVATVEQLTGLTVDHYVEVGFGGVQGVVDAVGGVELCLDWAASDPLSGLVWGPGCGVADGATALAFARMRHGDPEGDIGRTKRQQQLISSITTSVADPAVLRSPGRQVDLVRAGTDALTVSQGTGVLDLGRLALAFRAATGPEGITGTPPLASIDYRPGGVGSAVQLDEEQGPGFWAGIREGSLPPGPVGGVPQPG